MTIKFRNKVAYKKFTHKGCIEMLGIQMGNFEGFIDEYEQRIKETNENIDKIDIDIDCN